MPRPMVESVNCSLIAPEGLAEGQPTSIKLLIDNEEIAVIAVKTAGAVHVYRNRCPHQGRLLDFAPGRVLAKDGTLVCAAHGAVFAMADGRCLQGPCRGDALAEYALEPQADGRLRIAGLRTSG